MNEARIKKLAAERKIEFTKKMFKRFLKQNIPLQTVLDELATCEVKNEDVVSAPDFTFTLGIMDPGRIGDYVCVQSPDGKTIRVVGYMKRKQAKQAPRR